MSLSWSRVTSKLRWVGLAAWLATIVVGLVMVPGTIQALKPGGFEVSGGDVVQTEAEFFGLR